jgi:hypothetical protein
VATGSLISARNHRAPVALIAIALVVLQTMVAALATAQAAARLAPDIFTAAAICHGTGGASPADGSLPESDRAWPSCCAFCTAATPPLLPVQAPILARLQPGRDCGPVTAVAPRVTIAPRAVRAGFAQAPPEFA